MDNHYWIGIDLGIHGAIAVLGARSEIIDLVDMPHAGKPPRVCRDRIRELLAEYSGAELLVAERLHAMGGIGSGSAWTFCLEAAGLEWLFVGLGIRYELVPPKDWQRIMLAGQPGGDKATHRARARQLWPDADLGERKTEDRSDALLLAEYGRRLGRGNM